MRGFLGVGLGAVGLIALIVVGRGEPLRPRVALKAFTSLCFILSALEIGIDDRYDILVLAGLICGFLGDVLLALRGKKVFLGGMIAFALGHVLYAVAFVSLGAAEPFPRASIALVGLTACGTLAWFWPYLGSMRVPVAVYVTLIAIMLIAATGSLTINGQGRWLVAPGAAMFAVSDVFVARDRFIAPGFVNRLLGLPLYYAGQFLIAFSIGSF